MRREGEHTSPVRIGLAGIDNSRVLAFADLLHNPENPDGVAGAYFAAAWPGSPSLDFAMSALRYDRFLGELRDRYGVPMMEHLDEAAAVCDAWMLEVVDGRGREALFEKLVAYRKPIFVDKPFALDAKAAKRMTRLAAEAGVPVMSCSALRYAESLVRAVRDKSLGDILGADVHGPMELEPTQPGYFWYGIHMADMLFRGFGGGCKAVTAFHSETCDTVIAEWADGRIGTLRGYRTGREGFGGVLHREAGSQIVDASEPGKSYLAYLLNEIVTFFMTGTPPIAISETVEIIRFLEAANESTALGERVML
ncbi:Gfo/Idh/MocA family protein [Bacillus sp. FSL K6-6540]|uniref:Gfo/Idh/MocA family protein n=1 Tax=Bacillus sp. FSL K6-6540 TaxID=2921512 RepID=UPI0030F9B853